MSDPTVLFIRGAPRSGTTLLVDILDENPDVGILHEYPFERMVQQLLPILAFGQSVDGLQSGAGGFANREHPVALKQKLRYPTVQRYPAILKAVLEATFDKSDLKIIGSKTPGYSDGYQMDLVRHLFSDMRFIFCVRNPIGTIGSSLNRRNLASSGADVWHIKDVAGAVAEYRENIGLLRSHAAVYPNRCFVLGYEDLVGQPQRTLSAIGEFLGTDLVCSPGIVSVPSKTIMTVEEDEYVRSQFGAAIDTWENKRTTGLAGDIAMEFDDCLAVLAPGKAHRFDSVQGNRSLLGVGWSALDSAGVWSDDRIAELHFAVERAGGYALVLELAGYVPAADAHMQLAMDIDGQPALQGAMADSRTVEIRVSMAHFPAGAHRVTFRFGSLRSPLELGMGGDHRRLGVHLQSLRLESEG
jgi:hypothetical protein